MTTYVFVPKVPTEEMIDAAIGEDMNWGPGGFEDDATPRRAWEKMIAAAPSPWQEIETAPKDGTWVLLTGGDPYWDEDTGNRPQAVVGAWVPFPKPWDQEDGDWKFAFWDGALRSCYEKPTHWMPLPSPPTE